MENDTHGANARLGQNEFWKHESKMNQRCIWLSVISISSLGGNLIDSMTLSRRSLLKNVIALANANVESDCVFYKYLIQTLWYA
jgi:hypothetical protein